MTEWKTKNVVISRVISSTESESEESERFHFLPIPLMTPSLKISWKLDCRSRKQKWKTQPITRPKSNTVIGWFFRFCLRLQQCSFHYIISNRVISRLKCSASDSVSLIFTRSHRSTLLITTLTTTQSPVKTSIKGGERNVVPSFSFLYLIDSLAAKFWVCINKEMMLMMMKLMMIVMMMMVVMVMLVVVTWEHCGKISYLAHSHLSTEIWPTHWSLIVNSLGNLLLNNSILVRFSEISDPRSH